MLEVEAASQVLYFTRHPGSQTSHITVPSARTRARGERTLKGGVVFRFVEGYQA